jgi:hypothetical protein
MFRTGSLESFGIPYFGPLARDGVWHEALIGQLMKSVPPINPGLAGVVLTNYHYFFDLLISLLAKSGIPVSILLYKIFPILFSVLLGFGTYKLANILFQNKKVSLLAVFFAYYASSFGWIVDLIKRREIGGESAFWANQPVSMNLNPPFAISLVIIIFILILINSYIKDAKFVKAICIIILSGTLIGFKVYAGGVLLAGLVILGLKRIIFDRDFKILLISGFSVLLSLFIFIPQSKSSLGLLEIKPFWLIDTMVDAADRVGSASLSSKRFTYGGSGQWLKFSLVEILSFVIFFVGNLGTRIIGIFGLKKSQLRNDMFVLIFAIMIASFVPPLIFIQKGNPWNIVQFLYYFLYFAGFFAAYSLAKFPKIIIIFILIITPISSIATFRSWLYPNPPAYLPVQENQALIYLAKQTDGIVLKHPFDSNLRNKFKDPFPLFAYADNSYVSAFSGKSVFIEDVEQQIIFNTNYQTRLAGASRFFVEKDPTWANQFLRDNKIKYIYLPKFYKLPIDETKYNMQKIFENEDVNIYQVN